MEKERIAKFPNPRYCRHRFHRWIFVGEHPMYPGTRVYSGKCKICKRFFTKVGINGIPRILPI